MKVAYIFPPPWDPKIPSYTMALFAGSTRHHNHDFFGFDLNVDLFNAVSSEDKQLWNGQQAFKWSTECDWIFHQYSAFLDAYIAKMVDLNISLYAIYVQGVSKQMSYWLAEKIKSKSPNSGIILGGPQCFPAYDGITILENKSVDAICTGEGDYVWPIVLDVFSKKGNLHINVPGIAYKTSDGTIKGGEVPELVKNLDAIPFADFSSVDLSQYGVSCQLPIMASRGCINTCAFCNEKPNFYKYRSRSAKNIFEEIRVNVQVYQNSKSNDDQEKYRLLRRKLIWYIKNKLHDIAIFRSLIKGRRKAIPYVPFNDSLINGKIKELAKFCEIVIESGIQFNWGGMALLRKEMTLELLQKMKEAGCWNVSWGLESGSYEVIKLMQKRLFTMDLAKDVIRHTNEAGIRQSCSLIVGFPGETEEMFQETVQFVREYGGYFDNISVQPMMIVHNSTVYDQYEEFGLDYENAQNYLKWQTKDSRLDYETRLKRVDILESVLKDRMIKTEHD